jgi:hypothetical protein
MQKRTVINRAYKAVAESRTTSHIFRDEDWSGVSQLVTVLESSLPRTAVMTLASAEYKGVIGECGHRKVYLYNIIDEENCIDINAQITASFCGTMADPMGAYDLTLIMN